MKRIGKYEILSLLGQGGMGTVYKGRDAVIGRDVAIKVIHERALDAPTVKERFYREARSAGRLSHENITVLYDIDEENGTPFLVMEYLEGRDLREMLKAGVVLSDEEKLDIALQIGHGLRYAHTQGVIHRDIKPANIRVLPDGRVKIIDFGIARIQDETQMLTQTNLSLGTPRYMSPEQIKGEAIDRRSDIFSYGVLLYELIMRKSPFTGGHITTLIHNILHADPQPVDIEPGMLSDELHPIVAKCLAKDPDDRYQDFGAVILALQGVSHHRRDHPAPLQHDATVILTTPSALDKTMVSPSERSPRPIDKTTPLHEPRAARATPFVLSRSALKKSMWAVLGGVLALMGGYFIFRPADPLTDAPETPGFNARSTLAVLDSALAVADSILADTLTAAAVLPSDDGVRRADATDPGRTAADQEQRTMEQARRRVTARSNDAAVTARYQRAEQTRRTGTGQYEAGRFDNARQSFRSARALYEEVKRTLDEQDQGADTEPPPQEEEPPTSGIQADADRAREAMQTAKRNVPGSLQQTDAYRRALGHEEAGNQAYARRAFDRAAARFAEAQTSFDDAAATSPQEAAATAAVQALTRLLKTSLEQEDAATMSDVFYADWTAFFNTASDISATVNAGSVQVNGILATVDVRATLSYRDAQNSRQEGLVSYRWTLAYQEQSNTWAITQVATR